MCICVCVCVRAPAAVPRALAQRALVTEASRRSLTSALADARETQGVHAERPGALLHLAPRVAREGATRIRITKSQACMS